MPSSRKVLVVEADEDLQSLVAALLDDEGYPSEIVTSMAATLAALQRDAPALVLLDTDGLEDQLEEFVGQLRAAGGGVPIVLIGPRYEVTSMAEAVHADGSLSKPFEIDAFLDIVARFTQRGAGG